jgi:endoglucanase
MNQKSNSIYTAKKLMLLAALTTVIACGHKKQSPNQTQLVLLNQVGYPTISNKIALLKSNSQTFSIIDTAGNQVFTGTPQPKAYWPSAGDSVAIADFSALETPGKYYLVAGDSVVSYPFEISNNPYNAIGAAAIKAFYFNRTAIEIKPEFGEKWARAAGHPDTVVLIHESAATKLKPAGTKVSSPLGWYDAGDYNKYVVNSGISTYTLLKALEDYTDYFKNQKLNIPESKNTLPDILDETLFNLRWVITMQDSDDGGVYHKLTNKKFDEFIMPDKAVEPRYMVQKSTAATLDYAALLAKAARVLQSWEQQLPGLADSCRTRALAAWQWAEKNPAVIYQQPKDILTGGYGDFNFKDEKYWAACELWNLTGAPEFMKVIENNTTNWGIPSWGEVGTLGTLSLLDNYNNLPSKIQSLNIKERFLNMVDSLVTAQDKSAFRVSISTFVWGSNADVANMGMLKLYAYKLTKEQRYRQSAINDADYLLGRNATGYCFVTGFGSKPVMNIHHRPSSADGIKEPVPGFLCGGPNLMVLHDCGNIITRDTVFAAKSFEDETCSYSTNEIAINWNAPLAYLFNGLAASCK